MDSSALLEIRNLSVAYIGRKERSDALRSLDLSVDQATIHAIAGESGSGKTTLLKAILGLLTPAAAQVSGRILYRGTDLLQLSLNQLQRRRGREIGILFQDAFSALDPYRRIRVQVKEMIRAHQSTPPQEIDDAVHGCMLDAGIEDPDSLLPAYPHQLSLGQCQRVALALALAGNPRILLADEPSASLDDSTADRVSQLLLSLRRNRQVTVLLVSHEMRFLAATADRLSVIYSGQIVESGETRSVLSDPQHPFTQQWIACSREPMKDERSFDESLESWRKSPSCLFAHRCPRRSERCLNHLPELIDSNRHAVRCFHPGSEPSNAISASMPTPSALGD